MPDIAATLLEAIRNQSLARARRCAALQAKRQAHDEYEHYLKHDLPVLKAIQEANALLDATHRAGCLHDEIRHERVATKKATAHINALNKSEVLDKVFEMADELRAEGSGRLGYRPGTGEPEDAWWKRVDALRERVRQLWWENEGRILDGEVRYVEGLPVRDVVRPPRLEPHLKRDVETGLEACEGCVVAGVRCSRVLGFEGEGKESCVRCKRLERRCEDWKGEGKDEEEVDVVGGEVVRVDKAAFALPIWWDDAKVKEEQSAE